MSRSRPPLFLAILAALAPWRLLFFGTAAAATPETGVVWVAQPVRVASPADARPVPPFVPAAADEVTGDVTVGPNAAAAFWLDPLDLVRVRTIAGAPRFARLVGGATARALLDEPGVPAAPGVTYLAQPPGRGDVWLVWGREQAVVAVDRPVRRRGRLVWDEVEREVIAWIDRGGPPPTLPLAAGSGEVSLRLVAERQLGERLAGRVPRAELAAWRAASARALLLPLRPLLEGPFALAAVDVPGAGGEVRLDLPGDEQTIPYAKLPSAARFTVELEGPGVLRVEARALLLGDTAPRAPVRATIRAAGAIAATAGADADPVSAPEPVSPPPPFPAETPLTTGDGQAVGERAAAATALFPGRHRYEIAVEGGPLLVRATYARRRPRLGQGGDPPPAASARDPILAARLAQLAGRPAPAPAIEGAPAELRWMLFLEEARRRDRDGVRALVEALRETPPPEVLAPLADLLPEPTLVERIRSPQVAALELAWRARPLDPEVLARYRSAWRGAAWTLVPPDDDPNGKKGAPRPSAWTWLCESEPDQAGRMPALAPGAAARLVALPSPGEPERPARLDVYVQTAAERPGPITLRVDGRAWSTLALQPLERLEVAVPLGPHEVRVDGPQGTRAWASLPPATPPAAGAPSADLRRYWPLSDDGRSLRYELPDPGVPGPVRVALRALIGDKSGPVRVAIRTDAGERRTLDLDPGGADPLAHEVDAPGPVSGEVAVTLRLPPATRTLWISATAGPPIVAQVTVRRAGDQALPPPAADRAVDPIALVAAASRVLAARPRDAAALIRRAHALLDLDQGELARQDLLRLARLPVDAATGAAENGLLARLDAAGDSAGIVVPDAPLPLPLAPGLLGLARPEKLAPLARVATLLRKLGPADAAAALPPDIGDDGPVTAYLRARLSDDPLALARLAPSGPVLLEAADRLAHELGRRGTAALLFGLATRARAVAEHPRARRAFALAAALSRWDPIDGTEANAGQERLTLDEVAPGSPGAAAREALLAPPWSPRRAHTLVPGAAAAIDLSVGAPTRLTTQVFCAEVRAAGAPPSCVLTVRTDGQEQRVRAAADGQAGTVPARTLGPGRHHVEIALASDDPDVLASVRFLTDRPLGEGSVSEREEGGHPVPIDRPARYFAATPERPIAFAVLGPATLRVELRGTGGAVGPVKVEAGPGAAAEIALDRQPDPGVRGEPGRNVAATVPVETLLLIPAAGPQRVTLRPSTGRVLARFALRVDAAGKPPPLPSPWWEDAAASSLLPWPALPAPLSTVEGEAWTGCAPATSGSLSLGVTGGSEPLGERDAPAAVLRGVLDVGAAWHRQLADDRLWLRVAADGRAREGSAAAFGLSAASYLRHLPLELRAELRASLDAQPYADRLAASVVGRARLERSFDLSLAWSLVPALGLRAGWQSLDRETVVAAGGSVNPAVYNDYLRTRPLLAQPRATLYFTPRSDQRLALSAAAGVYSELDHVTAGLGWDALWPVLGETFVELAYLPSWRLQTADRPEAFLRHDLEASLRWSLWTGDTGRFVVGADGAAYLVAGSDPRLEVLFVLRYDLTSGRALHDQMPSEESFEPLVEQLRWEPAPPGRL